jgi:tetratricopeptide (TPR) repeat protein
VVLEEAAYGLARELDDIAVGAFTLIEISMSQQRKAVADYDRLFSREGLDVGQPDTARFSSQIRLSPARFALIAALDNWVFVLRWIKLYERRESLARHGIPDNKSVLAGFSGDPQLARLLELTRAADPDPWRDCLRNPAVWVDREALTRLAKEENAGRQSPTAIASLGWLLRQNGEDPTALFERALLDHPRDFWLLQQAIGWGKDPEPKFGLSLAILGVRQRNAATYCSLSWSLGKRGDWPEAEAAANRAIDLNPTYSLGYDRRGEALREQKDLPGAIVAFQKAIDLAPSAAHPRYSLGQAFEQQGRYTEAEQAYLGAVQIQPSEPGSYRLLAHLLATCPDDKARDGKRAVEYATKACERSGWNDPSCIDTLAAAYAEAGQFEEAVRYETLALDGPALKGNVRTAANERLELYKQKKPFREKGP